MTTRIAGRVVTDKYVENVDRLVAAADAACMTAEVILSMYGPPRDTQMVEETRALRAALNAFVQKTGVPR